MGKVEFGTPAQFAPRAIVDVDPIDLREQTPAAHGIELRAIRIELAYDAICVASERREMMRLKRAGRRDNVAGKTDRRRALDGGKMGAHRVRDIEPAIQQLVGLRVVRR